MSGIKNDSWIENTVNDIENFTTLKQNYPKEQALNELRDDCPYREDNKCKASDCANCIKYFAYCDRLDKDKCTKALNNIGITDEKGYELVMLIQAHFAQKFHKTDFTLSKEEVDKWIKEYCTAIEDEMAEVLECIYLENQANNHVAKSTLQGEIIDILHFITDLFLVGNCSYNDLSKAYMKLKYPAIKYLGIYQIDLFSLGYYGASTELAIWNNRDFDNTRSYSYNILNAVARLQISLAKVRKQISWKHWKKPNKTIDFDKLYDAFAEVFYAFMLLAALAYDNCDEIVAQYINKNLENIFRQERGY